VVALVLPVIGRLFDARSYGTAFAVATGLPVAGYALWRVLDGIKKQKPVARSASHSDS
jgi:hypothetical protein